MKNKVEYLYSVFNQDIIKSKKVLINALQGYKVINQDPVVSQKDVLSWFKENFLSITSIPSDQIWKFSNPLTKEFWYINQYFIAYSRGDTDINIILFEVGTTCIVTNVQYFLNWRDILQYPTYLTLRLVHTIGCLSTPHKVYTMTSPNINTIKLPYII